MYESIAPIICYPVGFRLVRYVRFSDRVGVKVSFLAARLQPSKAAAFMPWLDVWLGVSHVRVLCRKE